MNDNHDTTQDRGERMKILKWLAMFLVYVLLVLVIKNIQTILPILFEYKKVIITFLALLISTIFFLRMIYISDDNTEG